MENLNRDTDDLSVIQKQIISIYNWKSIANNFYSELKKTFKLD